MRRVSDLPAALERMTPRRLHLAAFHPTGTAAAGSDPARHPVDAHGRLRGAEGVLVADASILPRCPGVNPQVSIMALAAEVAARAIGAPAVALAEPRRRCGRVGNGSRAAAGLDSDPWSLTDPADETDRAHVGAWPFSWEPRWS